MKLTIKNGLSYDPDTDRYYVFGGWVKSDRVKFSDGGIIVNLNPNFEVVVETGNFRKDDGRLHSAYASEEKNM